MAKAVPEYVALADMEIHTAPGARVTMRPMLARIDGARVPLGPHLVLEQEQVRQLARDLLDAADQSAEEAGQERH